jgi:hypothetical protein
MVRDEVVIAALDILETRKVGVGGIEHRRACGRSGRRRRRTGFDGA